MIDYHNVRQPKDTPQTVEEGWKYAYDIMSKKIPSCTHVYKQIHYTLKEYKEQSRKYNNTKWYFDAVRAQKAISFFSDILRLIDDDCYGKPFYLAPWQIFCVMNIFGWRLRSDPTVYRYESIIIFMGRKNGKTTFVAGMFLLAYALSGYSAQAYTVATQAEQAGILYKIAETMVRLSAGGFKNQFNLNSTATPMNIKDKGKVMRTLSKNSKTQDGLKPSVVAFDEAAAIEKSDVFNVITSAQGANKFTMNFYLTTAQPNTNPFYTEVLEKILLGLESDEFMKDDNTFMEYYERKFCMAYLVEEEDEDRWDQPDVWVKANPNLGISLPLLKMESDLIEAKNSDDVKANFMVKRLNCMTSNSRSWINLSTWRKAEIPVTPHINVGECYITVDLSSHDDLTAICIWGTDDEKGKNNVIIHNYFPHEAYEALPQLQKHRYSQGIKEGILELLPGPIIDPNEIERILESLIEEYRPIKVGFDRWHATIMMNNLAKQYSRDYFIPIVQTGNAMNPAAMDLAYLISAQRVIHKKSKFLDWQVGNAVVTPNANGDIHPSKPKGSTVSKIDSLVCMLMAVHLQNHYEARQVIMRAS